jgi:hypothetical protein
MGLRAPLAYIARTVAIVDREKERQRLRQNYRAMADSELQEIAAHANSLSDLARNTLRFELARRHSVLTLPNPTAAPPPESEEPYRPVVLRTFRDLPDALLAKSILDSANVECFRMDWTSSNLLGGIKLWVRPEDADAGELLDQDHLRSFEAEGAGESTGCRAARIADRLTFPTADG